MPIHDWTRVPAGIFHDFHHEWISVIRRRLNDSVLPKTFYALAEQHASEFGPDVLTLQESGTASGQSDSPPWSEDGPATATLVRPKSSYRVQTDELHYLTRKKQVTVRHVSDDRVVAVIEIISPGNKAGKVAFRDLLKKTEEFLQRGIHLLLIDLFPPSRRDPKGLHEAIWEHLTFDHDPSRAGFSRPSNKPMTLVAYEAEGGLCAHIEPVAVGDALPDMPLVLESGGAVQVPLESTYLNSFGAVLPRWRRMLEPAIA